MSRRSRIFLRTALALFLAILATLGSLYYLLVRTPAWFKPIAMTEQERNDRLNEATRQLGDLATLVDRAAVSTQPSSSTFQLKLTEAQLHAYYQWFAEHNDAAKLIATKLKDPQIRLRDGQVIVAGRVPGVESVVNVRFAIEKPQDGSPRFKMTGVYGGSLPLPDAVIGGQKEVALRAIDSEVGRLREQMQADPPDEKALAVLSGMNLVELMNGKSVDSLVILKRGGTAGFSYARVTDASIDDGSASFTFRLATPDEIKTLTERMKRGY